LQNINKNSLKKCWISTLRNNKFKLYFSSFFGVYKRETDLLASSSLYSRVVSRARVRAGFGTKSKKSFGPNSDPKFGALQINGYIFFQSQVTSNFDDHQSR